MLITLNDSLVVNPSSYVPDLAIFAENLKRKAAPLPMDMQYKERKAMLEAVQIVRPLREGVPDILVNGYMHIASHAYSRHYALEVAPHDVWYIIMTQFATAVKEQPEVFRDLFTKSDTKQLVLVEQDHPTDINLNALIQEMKRLIPANSDLFLPELSTHTVDSQLACAAAFADTMSQYYDYGMFCCGIPSINLTGTGEDWATIFGNLINIRDLFSPLKGVGKLLAYIDGVVDIISNIGQSFVRPDMNTEFWMNIFTQRNVGSGGDLQVDGWLTKLYLENHPGRMIKAYHNTLTKVNYKNVSTGENFSMLHGAFRGVITPGNIMQAQYDHITYKLPAA